MERGTSESSGAMEVIDKVHHSLRHSIVNYSKSKKGKEGRGKLRGRTANVEGMLEWTSKA